MDDQILEYKVIKEIGQGKFSIVYLVQKNQKRFAMKQIPKLDKSENERIQTELNILKSIKNEFIVNYEDFIQTEDFDYIIMEYCEGGSLEQYLEMFQLSEESVIDYLYQIVQAFKPLKQLKIIHRDLKLANILLKDNKIKLADFGLSIFMDQKNQTESILGSVNTMAPEII